jgi:hypothetical protein
VPEIVEAEADRQVIHRGPSGTECPLHLPGPIWMPLSSVISHLAENCLRCAESTNVMLAGIGIDVREQSVFSESSGHCLTGFTTPRMKSISETFNPHTSASLRPANAASSSPTRYRGSIASCKAQTCSVVAI